MDIISLYNDYSIPVAEEYHRHSRDGWVNTSCPHCTGNPGYHLGFNVDENYYRCWRCGFHSTEDTLIKLLHLTFPQVKDLIKKYGGTTFIKRVKEKPRKINLKSYHHPSNTIPLTDRHKTYLKSRGFDADMLEQKWKLLSTGPISILDGIQYKHSILAPIFWDGEEVSFQTRDITGKRTEKYLTCNMARERITHKHILYGKHQTWTDTVICVEGITDVWRIGDMAAATFGIEFKSQQVRQLAKYSRVGVWFDPDPQAIKQAAKMISELRFRGVDAFNIDTPLDPADMSQAEVDYIVKQIK